MESRQYAVLLIGALTSLILLIMLLSWIWVRQPQTGDLARIGGYVEARYESRNEDPRTAFPRPLFVSLDNHEGGSFDVLVLGDSFSYTGGRYNWVSQFAAQTGLKVRVASIHQWWNAWRMLENASAPPPLIILQSVERDVVDHLANINHLLQRSGGSLSQSATTVPASQPMPGPLAGLERSPLPAKAFGSFDERISVTVDVLWKSMRRQLGWPRGEVVTFTRDTRRPPAFSAVEQELFVTIPADLASRNPQPRRWQQALEGLGRLRSRLNSTAKSHLALLVVPNRLSVYGPQLVHFPLGEKMPIAARLARETASFNAVEVLQASVSEGIQDVYWAMDTHLSAVGSELLAHGFVQWLERQGVLQRDSVIKSPLRKNAPG